ncbi:hypothetical protein BD779DRAFT_1532626, partial [Infundibulicybe gibba]
MSPSNGGSSSSGTGFTSENAAYLDRQVDTSFVAGARRPSWTPSLPDSLEYTRLARPSKSTSRLREDRTPDNHFISSPSLLTARRPSSTPSLPDILQRTRMGRADIPGYAFDPPQAFVEPASPGDGSNFRRSLQIDMKGLVGDAVGNMSISPASRDVVLAARRGLFIIDLEAPLRVPRFLPQGGTWDVADVQWNPHPSRAEYIVSTSSEKLLIWNLLLVGKTSIEHILHSHYRAITDINWHTTERDTVVSTGIDSWLWAWDLREPHRPIFGLSAFNSGGTQVKWNRQDPNVLASSHAKEVFIWDRRKGSLPVTRIPAHNSKIYGIDWSHNVRNEIVTCSLDKTIKVWDTNASDGVPEPKNIIRTTYPVWRARNLPFGRRGETALEMYARGQSQAPVETFEGHTDVVKEFVWRKGNMDENEFQLITWSKDRTLRFWPVDPEITQKVGHVRRHAPGDLVDGPPLISFRNPPEGTEYPPALSAPIGHRSILAEVRAPLPPRQSNMVLQPHQGSAARASSVARMDAFTWLSNVKVGGRRGSSSGPGSGANSADASRLSSRSRPPSAPDPAGEAGRRRRSDSRSRGLEDRREGETNQSLQDEITSVLTKLSTFKIKLEKHDLTKKRTCTLGLHGPWGESSSVFIRVTFTFPRAYPQGSHPDGTPTVELERNPLISMKNRATMLRRLRAIREQRRPCLEACLKYLLLGNEEQQGGSIGVDSGSSSEDDEPTSRKSRDFTVSLLRNHKNLAEPRTSQGTFGPNGELVCFFRAPPRIVRNVLRGLSESPAKPSEEPQGPIESPPRYLQSPSFVIDAVRKLSVVATDRTIKPAGSEDGGDMLRIMTNLLTFSLHKSRRDSQSQSFEESPKKYAVLPPRRSTVFITNTTNIAGGDRKVAMDYIFESQSPRAVCSINADIARAYGRYDHERAFRELQALFPPTEADLPETYLTPDSPALKTIIRLYDNFSKEKDAQMLAMTAIILLQAWGGLPSCLQKYTKLEEHPLPTMTPRSSGLDYFSLTKPANQSPSPISPSWPRLPSLPVAPPMAVSLSSSNSSRGSWSSLFNTDSMRQFMSGVQDSLKDGLITPLEGRPGLTIATGPIPVPGQKRAAWGDMSRRRGQRKDFSMQALPPASKPWAERRPAANRSTSFFSAGNRAPLTVRGVRTETATSEIRIKFFDVPSLLDDRPPPLFELGMVQQFICHIQIYSEILFNWQLFHKRLELLKVAHNQIPGQEASSDHHLGLVQACTRCKMIIPHKVNACPSCGNPCSMANCSICRLPVKGLSHNCVRCLHVTHISCWNALDVPICPTGCGCFCNGFDTNPANL